MATLTDLYNAFDTLRKMGLPIDDKLLAAADELEEKIIKEDILPALSQIIEPQLKEIKRDLVLVVEHHPGESLRVALSRKANIREMLNAKSLTSVSDAPAPYSHNPIGTGNDKGNGIDNGADNNGTGTQDTVESNNGDTQGKGKNPSKVLRVTFLDGTTIYHRKAIDTFIETLQNIGLERVASLGLECGGYNIVSRTQRPPTPICEWQHKVDGWYVYSNISNKAKVSFLERISDALHLSLKIELLTEEK